VDLARLGSGRGSSRQLIHIGGVLAFITALGLLHGGWIPGYLENAGKDGWYTDDVRNLLGFFVFSDPQVYDGDPVGAYSRAQSPFLHWVLMAFFAKLGLLRELTQYGPPVLWAVTAFLAARAGAALGRWPGAFLAATLVLGLGIYVDRISGLMPRALCYPAVFWFSHGLIRGRPKEAGAAVIFLAGFYPTVGAALGFCFAGWLLLFHRVTPSFMPIRQRLRTVTVVAGLSVLLLVPTAWRLAEFGPTTSHADWAAYPEAGPGGITGPGDRWPWRGVLQEIHLIQSRLVDQQAWLEAPRRQLGSPLFEDTVLFAVLLLVGLRARRDARARRLLLLGAGALFGHWVTRVFYPWMYAPTRAITYMWPPFFLLAMVAGAAELCRPLERFVRGRLGQGRPRRLGPHLVRLAVFGAVLAIVSGRGDAKAGTVFRQPESALALARFVEALPSETLVAGLPDDAMSNLAWVSGRQAFMTGEMHIPHHRGYLDQIRLRLFDFFDAYLAHEVKDVLEFADEYGVTHFLVDDRHFGPNPLRYMPPFAARVSARHAESLRRGGFALSRLGPAATVAERPPLRLVSIQKLRALADQ